MQHTITDQSFFIFLLSFVLLSSVVSIFLVLRAVKNELKQIKKPKKTKGRLSSVHARVIDRKLTLAEFDEFHVSDEDIEQLGGMTANKFLERQSRFYLECALNLMASSYDDYEEMKHDIYKIVDNLLKDHEIGPYDGDDEDEDEDYEGEDE